MHGPGGGGEGHEEGSEWYNRTGGTAGTAGAALVGYGIWVLVQGPGEGWVLPGLVIALGVAMLAGGISLVLRGAH